MTKQRKSKGNTEKLGVKIVVKFSGHMQKDEAQLFMSSLSTVIHNHLENGGNS
jgi:hypothetical protein